MVHRARMIFWCMATLISLSFFNSAHAQTNPFSKAQVGDRIRKVEDGVDEFRKSLENRGDNAKDQAESAKNNGATRRRQGSNTANTEARANQASNTKDDLEDSLDDL